MNDPVDFLTGRALRPGYTADTAPAGMRWVYDALAPALGTRYGAVLPVKQEADGRIGFAMPNVMREGLLGLADLLSATETGELTGRGAQSVTIGGLGAGMTMAPRGAVAAGSGRNVLPIDTASRMARAEAMGYRIPVFHGTNREINPGFSLNPSHRATSGMSAREGTWTAGSPEVAGQHAVLAARAREAAGQNILPLLARADRPATVRLWPGDEDRILTGAIRDSWDAGHDAARVLNYPNLSTGASEVAWVFENPSQLRSPFAMFDPAKRESADLLAGFAAPGPVPIPGFNVREPGLRFDPALVPNHLRRPQDRVY